MVMARDIRSGRRPRSRSASVRSILALAGGAAAIPLAEAPADAAIIVDSSLSGTVIGWNTVAGQIQSVFRTLPGTGIGGGFTIDTRADENGFASGGGFFGVRVAGALFQRSRSYLNQAYLAPADATVNAGTNVGTFANVNLGTVSYGVNYGNAAFSESSKYLLFSFSNSGTTNYGWIELTATTTGVIGEEQPYVSGYSATLGSWAYDNSGAPLAAGVVPEPATASMAMGGALVAGAVGLRRWRKQRARVASAGGQA